MKKDLNTLLKNDFVCLDGSMGAIVMAMGHAPGDILKLNVTEPETITGIHRGYFEAGSDIVFTNTFDLSEAAAERLGIPLGDIVRAAVDNALEAAEGREDRYVLLDLSPSGMDEDKAAAHYEKIIRAAEGRTDGIILETMTSLSDMKAVLKVLPDTGKAPLLTSITVRENGKTWFGDDIKDYIDLANASDIVACGINCTLDPEGMLPFARMLKEKSVHPVFAKPNRGQPRRTENGSVYDMSAEDFAEGVKRIASEGIHILGGCCGSDAECIKKICEALKR